VKSKIIDLRPKRPDQAISSIAVKVADAIELSQEAKDLAAKSRKLLIDVQQDLEDLYIATTDAKEPE